MHKVVVAYIDSEKFDVVRRDLGGTGITHLAAITAGAATPDPFAAPAYSGSPHTMSLTEKTRLEFVVHEADVETVQDAIFRHAGAKTFMFAATVDHVRPDGAANRLEEPLESDPAL